MSLIFLKESPTASPFTSFPSVIGHEICGRIAAVGSKVTRLEPGDVVTIAPALNCAAREISPACPACRNGMIVGGGVISTMVRKAIRGLDIDCTITVVDPSTFAADQAKQAGADHVITYDNVFSI